MAFEAICLFLDVRPIATLFHRYYTMKGLVEWWFIAKQPKAPVKLFDGLESSTNASLWKKRFWVVSHREGFEAFPFWTKWYHPIHKGGCVKLMDHDH